MADTLDRGHGFWREKSKLWNGYIGNNDVGIERTGGIAGKVVDEKTDNVTTNIAESAGNENLRFTDAGRRHAELNRRDMEATEISDKAEWRTNWRHDD